MLLRRCSDQLRLSVGATVGVTVEGDRLVIETRPRPRYTMAELLNASDYSPGQLQQSVSASMRQPLATSTWFPSIPLRGENSAACGPF